MSVQQLDVVLDDDSLGPTMRVGRLLCERGRSGEVISFEYDAAYLASAWAIELDHELPLHAGRFHPASERPLFGVFRDTAPDRWGRVLMERREALEARQQGRRPRGLSEWDFLIGVSDTGRLGALRLREPEPPHAFVDHREHDVPPYSRLRELENIARRLEHDDVEAQPDYARWLTQLLAPGSSLGGARPKASFISEDGQLWIAKFPAQDDRRDVGAWEYFASLLARAAGVAMPDSMLLELGSRHRTYAVRRFDRAPGSRRLYASAMTMLQQVDGARGSYLEIAEQLHFAGDPDFIAEDLAQLYRRVVFSILIGNRDDHLRNHGFLRSPAGWRLSPAFDVNPNPDKREHALAIDELDPTPSVVNLRSTHPYYRLDEHGASVIEAEVRDAVRGWLRVAVRAGVSKPEQRQLGAVIDPERA